MKRYRGGRGLGESSRGVFARLLIPVLLLLICLVSCAPGGPASAAVPTSTATPMPVVPATSAVVSSPTSTPVLVDTLTPAYSPPLAYGHGVDGWAVLAEKDDYKDVGMTDLPVGYINTVQLRQLLLDFGWQESHIRELREFNREDLRQALGWLAANADEDDLVFFYVAAHGKFLREVVRWGDFIADDWAAVPSRQRVIVVDACQAAQLTAAVRGDPQPYLAIAAVDEREYGWSGLPEEGLPIIGGVFTHYFAAAFLDLEADADGNGTVSFQEAARHAEGGQRTYMHDVVFAVPAFVEMYHEIGASPEQDPEFPHVVVDDTFGHPIYLEIVSSSE